MMTRGQTTFGSGVRRRDAVLSVPPANIDTTRWQRTSAQESCSPTGPRGLAVCALALAFVGCGGGNSGAQDDETPGLDRVNSPPQISGAPATTVEVGQPYSFTPTASDPDGDGLVFSIDDQPAWATFDAADGSVGGSPDAAAVGTTPPIVISVSDGSASASLTPFTIEVLPSNVTSVTIHWDPPTTNADGTPLIDLAGYRVYYGVAPGNYSNVVEVADEFASSVSIPNLQPGLYYFAVSALDRAGNESVYSTEIGEMVVP